MKSQKNWDEEQLSHGCKAFCSHEIENCVGWKVHLISANFLTFLNIYGKKESRLHEKVALDPLFTSRVAAESYRGACSEAAEEEEEGDICFF